MNLLRKLPKIDKFIALDIFKPYNQALIKKLSKVAIETFRKDILEKKREDFSEEEIIAYVLKNYENSLKSSLRPLINATGVIMHTNLGRSLIDARIFEKVKDVVTRYNNLEYNLEKGCRGERYEHVSKSLSFLLGCEDVLVVNNNASAVFLILNTFAKAKESIVSRGELVEIGGSFRVPEVMANSGTTLVEVGATNKTKLSDYEEAINEKTAMLMKVHKSNYSIEGFSDEVSFEALVALAKERNILDYFDLGSGYVKPLPYNLGKNEPSLHEVLACEPSLVSFSGDKLLGSVQAGIIVGKKELIAKLKKNQLLRMLRVDKLTLALLEESVKAYILQEYDKIPTLKMLHEEISILEVRAKQVQEAITSATQIVSTKTFAGGGTLPNKKMPSIALKFTAKKANILEARFRKAGIIGRIEDDAFLLDFRSIQEEELNTLIALIRSIDFA